MNTPNVAGARDARRAPAITKEWLERAALHYLDRYAASAEMLRRVLARRVERRARAREEAPEAFAELIEATVERAQRAGLVDDARFAAARLATLRRRGVSSRGAGAKLAAKGVDRETVEAALAGEREEAAAEADVEAAAARAYARRRRFGPHRRPDIRAANRERDLAAMVRAGFPFPVAQAAIDEAREDGPEP